MKIQRQLLSQLRQTIQPGKVVVLYGPRQVGKTTLVQELLAETSLAHTYINADELVYREAFGSQTRRTLGDLLGHSELLVIDEAQRVPDSGFT